jgi:DHA1 family purine ribonucleoside efflux pump-like MFS transporter
VLVDHMGAVSASAYAGLTAIAGVGLVLAVLRARQAPVPAPDVAPCEACS